jgi:hypothetical protein
LGGTFLSLQNVESVGAAGIEPDAGIRELLPNLGDVSVKRWRIELVQPGAFIDSMTEILRSGARSLLTEAV